MARARLRSNEVGADSIANQVAEGIQVQLEHNSGAVTLHRSRTNQEQASYFLVLLALREKGDDVTLARRERTEGF